jgi:tellurite resistance protein TerB
MGFFSGIVKSAKQVQKQNLLEAIIGASLLVAASDGDIEDEETKALTELLASNDSLKSFGKPAIQKIVDRYTAMLKAGFRVGKVKMMREIADIADSAEDAEEVFVTALTIAESDGEIEPKELEVLKEIGRALGVSLSTYGLA